MITQLFWRTSEETDSAFERLVSVEVREAIRELLTANNSDFFLWWFSVPDGSTTPHLHMEVIDTEDGSPIEKNITITEMVSDAIDGFSGLDGVNRVEEEDKRRLELMVGALRDEADRIEKFLRGATIIPDDPENIALVRG